MTRTTPRPETFPSRSGKRRVCATPFREFIILENIISIRAFGQVGPVTVFYIAPLDVERWSATTMAFTI